MASSFAGNNSGRRGVPPPVSDMRRVDPSFDNRQFNGGMHAGYVPPVFTAGPIGGGLSMPQHHHHHQQQQQQQQQLNVPSESMYYPPVGGPPPPPPPCAAMGEPIHHPGSNQMGSISPPAGSCLSNGAGGVHWIEEESKESTDTVLVRISEIHQAVTEEDMRRVFESVGTSARQLVIRPGRHEDEVVVVATFQDIYAAEHVINTLNMRNIYDNGNKMLMSFMTRRAVGSGGPGDGYGGGMMMGMNGGGNGGSAVKNPHGGGGMIMMNGAPQNPSSGHFPPSIPPQGPMSMGGGDPYANTVPPESLSPFSGPGGRMEPPLSTGSEGGMRVPCSNPPLPMNTMIRSMNGRDGMGQVPPSLPPSLPPPSPQQQHQEPRPISQSYFSGEMRGGYMQEMRGREGGMNSFPQPYYSPEGTSPPQSLPAFGRGRGRGGGFTGRGGRGREIGAGGSFPFIPFPDNHNNNNFYPSTHRSFNGRGGGPMMMREGENSLLPFAPPYLPSSPMSHHHHHMAAPQMAGMQKITPYLSVKAVPLSESLHSIFVLLEAFGGVVSIRRNQKNKEIVTVKMASPQNADPVVEFLQQIPFCGTTVSAKRFPSYIEQTPCTDDGDSKDPDTVQFDFTAAQHRSPGQRSKCAPSNWIKITGCGGSTEAELTAYLSENNFFPTRIAKVEDPTGPKNGRNGECFIVQLADVETAVKLLVACQGNVCGMEKTNVIFIPENAPGYPVTNSFQGSGGSAVDRNEEKR